MMKDKLHSIHSWIVEPERQVTFDALVDRRARSVWRGFKICMSIRSREEHQMWNIKNKVGPIMVCRITGLRVWGFVENAEKYKYGFVLEMGGAIYTQIRETPFEKQQRS